MVMAQKWIVDGVEIRFRPVGFVDVKGPEEYDKAFRGCNMALLPWCQREKFSTQMAVQASVAVSYGARLFIMGYTFGEDSWSHPLVNIHAVQGCVSIVEFCPSGNEHKELELCASILVHDPNKTISRVSQPERWIDALLNSRSPIERRLLIHMMDKSHFYGTVQAQVACGNYKIDFGLTDNETGLKLAIEADGHEFHQKTKEQAQHDKARDRFLTAQGWHVVRFTGSEIWREPERCAEEVGKIIDSLSPGA